MDGRRVWVSVAETPRLGTVVRSTYTLKDGERVLAVELDEPVDGITDVVVNPHVDDVMFEPSF